MENQFQLTRRGRLLTLIIGAVIWGIIILAIISGTIEKWLWMKQLDYTAIFWTLFSVKWLMFCLAFIVAFLYLWINLHLAIKKGAVLLEGNSAGSLNIDWEMKVPLFLRKLVLGIPAQASGKNYAAANASGGPSRPASLVGYPARGIQ
ncbi:MAG: UPF0182 family protein, partial [Methylobacter sp.]